MLASRAAQTQLLRSTSLSAERSFSIAARLALATTLLMFGLIVVGSIVRTTGSGLACPDWPLCEGRVIPRFEFHVLIEWFHRVLALLVSLLIFATGLWIATHREVRARLGGLMLVAVGLLFVQVLLGALTVWKLLDTAIVSSHLATALLLFSTLLSVRLIAAFESVPPGRRLLLPRPPGLGALFTAATLLIFVQAVLGGVVSTSHASLACPDWPRCGGVWFPPLEGLVAIQMAHRWVAYGLAVLLVFLAFRARTAADPIVTRAGVLLLGMLLAQVAVGVLNIMLGIKVWLSAIHLANAAMMLAIAVGTTFRLLAMHAAPASGAAEATS